VLFIILANSKTSNKQKTPPLV